jgi:hypothetical protein
VGAASAAAFFFSSKMGEGEEERLACGARVAVWKARTGSRWSTFPFPGPSDLEIDGLIIYLWALGLQWKFRLLFEHNNLFPFFAFAFGNKYNSN